MSHHAARHRRFGLAAADATIREVVRAARERGGARGRRDLDRVPDAVPVVFCVAGILGGLPVSLLLFWDAFAARGALARGVQGGRVIVFGQGEEERVVLAEGGILLARAGRVCARARAAEMDDAAPRPDTAGGKLATVIDGVRWVERALAEEERAELRRRAVRLGRPHWLLWAWTVMAAGGIAVYLARGKWEVPPWIPTLFVLLSIWWGVLSARRTRKRLEVDAATGVVVRAVEGEHAGAEVLPLSGWLWTEAEMPAPWRTAKK